MPSTRISNTASAGERALLVRVVFPLPLEQEFVYSVPKNLQGKIVPGTVVSAPFRNSIKTGFVTAADCGKPGFPVKEIDDLLYDTPVFTAGLLKLARWMSGYYFASTGGILDLMLPVRLNRESVELITPRHPEPTGRKLSDREQNIMEIVRSRGRVTPKILRKELGRRHLYYYLDKLRRNGFIEVVQTVTSKSALPKTSLFYKPVVTLSAKKRNTLFAKAPKQKEMYVHILEHNPSERKHILRHFPGGEGVLSALVKKGLVEKYAAQVTREYGDAGPADAEPLPPLTSGQRKIIDTIERIRSKDRFNVFLLHGVTGSGKTRVYLELVHEAVRRGEGVLFLVPEIALTNYFLSTLRACFGKNVAVLHSRMSAGERTDSWSSILSGEKTVVIGPRSAVFAPVKNLKLIVVDEEHDFSYKQHESPPYYNARDVAVYRGRLSGGCVVLGSATPSMESYYNAQKRKYRLLELPERIDKTPLPEVFLIDMKPDKEEKRFNPVFSSALLTAVRSRLQKGEQILLMQNRRGYSTFIQCRDCGFIETCSNCRITLTYHKKEKRVRCHFCDYTAPAPVACPECGGLNMKYSGLGTQQVEEALKENLPGYRTIRMDLDTTRSKRAHDHIREDFERGYSDILIGTQMISKGFDFGRVNLVGIISADTGLLMPEFRAAERTFQLLTQAAGRAGRRKERGLVMIQTFNPDHYSLRAAQNHDYHLFYEQESALRSELDYPPFGRIILLRFSGRDEREVEESAAAVGAFLRRSVYRRYVLGPAPAPIEMIRKRFRWQIFLKSGKSNDRNGKIIRAAARFAHSHFVKLPSSRSASMTIDVDPVNLM